MTKLDEKTVAASVWSTIVAESSRPDVHGEIRRCWDPNVAPSLGFHGCQTMYEGFRHGAALNPLGPCLGYRAVSTSGFATPFIYSSYQECLARVNSLACGLDVLQLVPRNNAQDRLRCLGLYMRNCMEWVLAEQAVYALGGCTVPFYDTLGPDTVQFILDHTETQTVICSRAELPKLCEVKENGGCKAFKTAVLVDGVTDAALDAAQKVGLNVVSYAKVEAVGSQQLATPQGHKHSPPSPDDICTFCYTSGTTGNPKGALITHRNLIAAAAGMVACAPDAELQLYDRHLSYLPLAHIFERVVMAQVLIGGASAAFYRGQPEFLVADIQACRPTFIPMVPRVLNKLHDKIKAGFAQMGGLKKSLFDAGLAAKTKGLRAGHLTHALYDRLIFNKIKKGLGMDQLRMMVSGSAPLSPQVMDFFRCLLGVPVVEGYGQTEGAAAATIGHPDHMTTSGHVGGPGGSVEICLFDVADMGYLQTDRQHRDGSRCVGRGEVCIRGPSVFKGYYKDEEKTKETIDSEGWLHSGDIGLWRPDGTLQIIDRKKNLFKLSQGEYVAPEKVENILLQSPLIGQVFVYGDSFQNSIVAIVVPDSEVVPDTWVKGEDERKQLEKTLKDEIRKLSRKYGLHGFETVKAIHLTHEPFSVENELLTPTFKLKRVQARERYQREIEKLYAGMSAPKSKL